MSVSTGQRIGLINKSSKSIDFSEIIGVARALQIQVDRDFGPIWGVRAQITPFRQDDSIPPGVWPINIVDHPTGGLGIHLGEEERKPYAEVQASDDPPWSSIASHELLEMLADPYALSFKQAPSIDPDSDGHLVSYLVEVGDPCEIHSYSILNVEVSDFVTQQYYNPHAVPFESLDFMTRLHKPYEVPLGCYISWEDPLDRRWHQKNTSGEFVTSEKEIDFKDNPRRNRDLAFGPEEEKIRHDLPKLLKAYQKRRNK
jgi:hypothetical protein